MNNTVTATGTPTYTTHDLFDLSLLEEMDDAEYLLEMLDDVLTQTPKDLKEMHDAVKAGKVEIVCLKAHKLKSSAAIIQAAGLTALFEKIEIEGKRNAPLSEITVLVDQALTEYRSLETSLKNHVAKLQQ